MINERKLIVLSCVIIAAIIVNCSIAAMNMLTVRENMLTVKDTNNRIKVLEDYVESQRDK